MKNPERGEIATAITIGTLIILGVSSLVSSVFLNKNKQTTKTKAAETLGVCSEAESGQYKTKCMSPRERQSCDANAGVTLVYQCNGSQWKFLYPECSQVCSVNVPEAGAIQECNPGEVLDRCLRKDCDGNLNLKVCIERVCDSTGRLVDKTGSPTSEKCVEDIPAPNDPQTPQVNNPGQQQPSSQGQSQGETCMYSEQRSDGAHCYEGKCAVSGELCGDNLNCGYPGYVKELNCSTKQPISSSRRDIPPATPTPEKCYLSDESGTVINNGQGYCVSGTSSKYIHCEGGKLRGGDCGFGQYCKQTPGAYEYDCPFGFPPQDQLSFQTPGAGDRYKNEPTPQTRPQPAGRGGNSGGGESDTGAGGSPGQGKLGGPCKGGGFNGRPYCDAGQGVCGNNNICVLPTPIISAGQLGGPCRGGFNRRYCDTGQGVCGNNNICVAPTADPVKAPQSTATPVPYIPVAQVEGAFCLEDHQCVSGLCLNNFCTASASLIYQAPIINVYVTIKAVACGEDAYPVGAYLEDTQGTQVGEVMKVSGGISSKFTSSTSFLYKEPVTLKAWGNFKPKIQSQLPGQQELQRSRAYIPSTKYITIVDPTTRDYSLEVELDCRKQ